MNVFKLADIFQNGMILQRDLPVYIYGEIFIDCELTITLDGQTYTNNYKRGPFRAVLKPVRAGCNYKLAVSSQGQNVVIDKIYCGEVFIAGGQSNMAMYLRDTDEYKENNKIDENSDIRFYTIGRNSLPSPSDFGDGYEWAYNKDSGWDSLNSHTAPFMSAVAYHFARYLYKSLKVPVGIINCNVGGSNIYCWMPEDIILAQKDLSRIVNNYRSDVIKMDINKQTEAFRAYLDDIKKNWYNDEFLKSNGGELPSVYYEEYGIYSFKRPSFLYHSMLKKVIDFNVRGMIWYQGESDAFAECADIYKRAMYTFIDLLKCRSKNDDYAFQFVQIAPWQDENVRQWEDICNAQREFFTENPRYGMVTTGDCGGGTDIHPPKKKKVGERLAKAALNNVFGIKSDYTGPCAVSAKLRDGQIIIDFIHNDGMYIKNDIGRFEIEYETDIVKADAFLSDGKVIIKAQDNPRPLYVRYEWRSDYQIGLYNSSDIPASLFRLKVN